ncbi:MAG: asparagine synthase (glutamine-hydrolyzing) [Candidatus Thorarchaeota archaeon]|jgi:asparagine synthase (glutamine-hydrolysing)
MCGIAGYIGTVEISPERLDKTLGLMKRRGPDASGVYHQSQDSGKNVYLLHRRLSIIDLDKRANQPFRMDSKVLVYNGELYNYLEIKSDLAGAGHSFETTSDTEVLLRTLHESGWRGLEKCEGMWAFALYDERERSLLLARDRFGEKPLYLYEDDTGLYFGSEIKFLSALSGRRFEINYDHLYRYLVNGYKSLYKMSETFFKNVVELPPSTVLTIATDGSKSHNKYWYPTCVQDESMTYEDAVSAVREALIQSVKLRLRADVPLAFCMSGGVDSNSLISIAKRVLDYEVHGFTIVNSDERYAEQDLVDHAVSDLDIKHTAIPANTTEFLTNLRRLIHYHDAPVYTISYYAHWLLMKSISDQGYRITVSGTAADELLTGYYDHHSMYLYEVRQDSARFDESLVNWDKFIRPIVRNPLLQDPCVFINNPHQREHIYLEADRFASYLNKDFSEEFTETRYCDGLLRNRMLNELFQEAVPVILHEDDLNAMYFSIENRSPFLDRKLFEVCYSIPTRHLIQDGYNKKVLRDCMKGIVPEKILATRRKVGFNASIYSFLDVNDSKVSSYLLDNSVVFEHVSKEKVQKIITKSFLTNSESKFLFNFLCTKIFLEEFGS